MSVADTSSPTRVAASRSVLFFAFWLMVAGYHAANIPVGVITALAATWASLRLLPPTTIRLRLLPLARFVLHFLGQSASSGLEVAGLAFNPRLPLRPGLIVFPCRLQTATSRSAFCAISSLLPGTLPTGSDEEGALVIHCLDVDKPVAAGLAVEEALVTRMLGHD